MLNKDYKEMLQFLLEEQVDFILVGELLPEGKKISWMLSFNTKKKFVACN